MDQPYFVDFVREFAETRTISDQVLMDATNQFRYTEDVSETNIVAVYYIKPISDLIDDMEYEENEELINIQWAGFDIIDIDAAYGGYWDADGTLVYGDPTIDGQYHGTTYLRLKQSAPELEIPVPPSPPYSGE